MIVVPFLFFLVLTIYWWRTHGLDVCTYTSMLYTFTAMLGVIIVFAGLTSGGDGEESGGMLWGSWEPVIGFLPTISFCAMIGLSILPFSLIHTKEIENIKCRAPFSLLAISALFIITGLIEIYCVADSTAQVLSGDLEYVRQMAYSGDITPAEQKAQSLPFPLGYILYLNFATILALPIMFYNLCFENRPWWWNGLLLISSMSSIMAGIQRVDRTEPVFFALMFMLCLVMFHRFFSKKVKIAVGSIVGFFAVVFVIYIASVSIARFEDRKNSNTITSIAQYGGQGFLNYCYFCENGRLDYIECEREFPLVNHLLFKIDSNGDRRGERSARQGFFISVFATFIGDMLLDLTPFGMFFWVVGFALITTLIIGRRHRKEFDVSDILLVFMLASIPIFGIFYYRYHGWTIAFVYVIAFLFWIVSNFKIVYEDTDDNSDL